jgi:homoserine kinase
MSTTVKVFAPATVANLAVGYDILGLAIEGPGDVIEAGFHEGEGLIIRKITGDNGKLPYEALKNTAGYAALRLLAFLGKSNLGIYIDIHKKMPFGSGMGSSAASAAGAVHAINLLLGQPLKKIELLKFAVEGEQIADGAYHADNVAPSLLGGIQLIRDNTALDVINLPVPENLFVSVIHPEVSILTKDARNILKSNVPINLVVKQTGNLAAFVASLYREDYALMKRSLHDQWIEPQRAPLIPKFNEIKDLALQQNCICCSISGAGPSIFALFESEKSAIEFGQASVAHYSSKQLMATFYASPINKVGCKEIKS